MSRRLRHVLLAIGALVVLVGLDGAFYTVREGQVAVVTRFGRVIRSAVPPGLHSKIPLADTLHIFDGRLRTLPMAGFAVFTHDRKRVKVEAYVKWRISDARQYLAAVDGNRRTAARRLQEIVESALRAFFGRKDLEAAIAGPGGKLAAAVNKSLGGYGIKVVDVRLLRIGLSRAMVRAFDENMEATLRARAQEITARGAEDADAARAQAGRQRAAILAAAYVKAQTIRGKADAKAAALYAAAYGRHPHFFVFYRSLRNYERGFANGHTVLILGPDSGLLRYLPIGSGR